MYAISSQKKAFKLVTMMKTNEAIGLLSQALSTNDYPTSYLGELTNLLGLQIGTSALLSTHQHSQLQQILYSISQQVPVEYLVGSAVFYNRRFTVTRDVLIPRFDSEKLIELALDTIKNVKGNLTILDIGTGSGALIITLAFEVINRSDTVFWATDISNQALLVARRNAETYNIAQEISFFQADVYPQSSTNSALLPKTEHVLIVTNPPYISQIHFKVLPKSVKDYEPPLALKEDPSFLSKLAYYVGALQAAGKKIELLIEYNSKEGTAFWECLHEPTSAEIIQLTAK